VSDTDAVSLRLQVSVSEKQRLRLIQERDDALRELRDTLAGVERTQATLSRLQEQIAGCESCQARRRAKALASQDW
jgi:aspartate oxidase